MTLPMLTRCPHCHGWHAHRCDTPAQQLAADITLLSQAALSPAPSPPR